jgi:outer membrane protein assembly factor BamB
VGSLGFLAWSAARSDGIDGSFKTELRWRWTPTAEARYLERLKTRPASAKTGSDADGDATNETSGDGASESLGKILWPRFRGANGDSVVGNVVLDSAWKESPPRELWRVPIGPGWSSFVMAGNRLFTQEQRDDHEVTLCLDARSGAELWAHATQGAERFWEPIAGTGPRATPTLHEDMLIVLGATGILERLDPRNGKSAWSRDLRKDAQRDPPTWGFSSSPLIVGSTVVVHAGGADGKGILAYDVGNGEPRWQARAGDHSYSSPHRALIDDQELILMLTNTGLTAVEPESGEIAWEHSWEYQGYRVVQPLVVDGSSILLGTGMDTGTMRIDVSRKNSDGGFYECWLSTAMRPDFNDYVAHRGHLYGFDRNMFASVDLETGKRNWKGGRYGNGQALLLPDADQILVLSETGELVLLEANPKRLTELARQKILSGKTWNHPVLIGDRLYARNGEEAVAYSLSLAK